MPLCLIKSPSPFPLWIRLPSARFPSFSLQSRSPHSCLACSHHYPLPPLLAPSSPSLFSIPFVPSSSSAPILLSTLTLFLSFLSFLLPFSHFHFIHPFSILGRTLDISTISTHPNLLSLHINTTAKSYAFFLPLHPLLTTQLGRPRHTRLHSPLLLTLLLTRIVTINLSLRIWILLFIFPIQIQSSNFHW